MTEKQRLISLFEKLYKGSPWIDVTLFATLHQLSPAQAAKRTGSCNTIWEIVNHLVAWRKNVLQRLEGKTLTTPADNYIRPVRVTSSKAWQKTLQQLEASQAAWIQALQAFDMKKMNTIYPKNGLTYYEHIQGILQHDAYHLGQIVLLAKLTPAGD